MRERENTFVEKWHNVDVGFTGDSLYFTSNLSCVFTVSLFCLRSFFLYLCPLIVLEHVQSSNI